MSNNKNIAIVVNAAWNIYNYRLGLAKALIKNGFNVITIAPNDEFVREIEEIGCKFIELKNLRRKGKNPIRDVQLVYELKQIYNKENIKLALHYTIKPIIFGTISASLLKIKSINTLTGLGYSFQSNNILNFIASRLYKFSLNKSSRVLFQNIDDKKMFLDKNLVKETKVGVVNGSGINTDYFKSKIDIENNKTFELLFIGRLLKDKGIFELIDSCRELYKKHKKLVLNIVGEIDNDNPASISQKQLSVLEGYPWIKYHGIVKDTRSYIDNCHVVILPSYREGVPRVLLEGMAMSKPIITTDVPGCKETIINNQNGFLVPVKDSKVLSEAIEKMIQLNKKDRIKMGEKGREIVLELFDEKIIIKNYLDEINKFI